MTLTQLKYVVAIVEANLNITLAAERVHATQPGISKQLKLLEEELGLQIFVRRGKSLGEVSPAGAEVIARARAILAEAANIQTLAANHRRETAGDLVIATTQTQARFVLPDALKALKAHYPDVNVRLNLFADAQAARLAQSDADVLIASALDEAAPGDLLLPLYHWTRVALVPRDHPLAHRDTPLGLADLEPYPLIGYESALGSHASVAAAFAKAGLEPRFAYTAHDIEVIKTYVRTGLGVGLMAEMALGDDEDLVALPVAGLPICTAFAAIRRDRLVRDYVADFLAGLARPLAARDILRALRLGVSLPAKSAPAWGDRKRDLARSVPAPEPEHHADTALQSA